MEVSQCLEVDRLTADPHSRFKCHVSSISLCNPNLDRADWLSSMRRAVSATLSLALVWPRSQEPIEMKMIIFCSIKVDFNSEKSMAVYVN